MRALDRKLLRELGGMKAQVLTIALVAACGIAGYVSMGSTYRSLLRSRDAYYASARFADVFAQVTQAPRWIVDRARQLPGVAAAEGRVVGEFRLEVPGFPEPVRGRFVSLPEPPQLNLLTVKDGRLPQADDEVVVSELFAKAHGLRPGGRLVVYLNGRKTELRVTGLGVSPEYVWVLSSLTMLGDDLRFGVLWMREPLLSASLRLEGRFNDLALALAPGASAPSLVDAIDRLLEPWGAFSVVDRSRQSSNRLINQELGQLETSATAIPLLFLGVAAFLLNVLLSRIVSSQREQIATLRALGYSGRRLGWHYVQLSLVIVGLGALLGAGLGAWLGSAFVRLYTQYFHFPELRFFLDARSLAAGAGLSAATAVAGAWGAVRRVLRLAPAEAMRPEAPASFRPTLLERLGLHRLLPIGTRMVLRDLARQPARTALSSLAVAFATAILVVGNMGLDSVEHVFGLEFGQAQRQDLTIEFGEALPARVLHDVSRLPGVLRAEPRRSVAVRLRSAAASRETVLIGVPDTRELQQVVDLEGRPQALPAGGLVLSRILGERLGVSPGDLVEVEFLEGERRRLLIPVGGLVDDALGLQGYLPLHALGRLLQESPRVTEVLVRVDRREIDRLSRTLAGFPKVLGVARREVARDHMRARMAESFVVMQLGLLGIAVAMAAGVVYNNARIALATRSRDLATLRILGYQRDEVAAILISEQAVQLLLGVPVGLPLGRWLGAGMYSLTEAELFRIPTVVTPPTFASAAVVVALSGAACALLVARRARRLDLVSVLKARD